MSVALRAVTKRMARRRPAIRISCTGWMAPSMYPIRRIDLPQPIRRRVEPALFVRLASVGTDDAHAVDPFDHPVRQLRVRSRDGLAQFASALREEPHDARDEEHPERHDECQPPRHQEQQHDVHDDRAGRDDQMDENLQRFARPPRIGREDVQQSSRAVPFDCSEAHGQQLIEDAAAAIDGRCGRPPT